MNGHINYTSTTSRQIGEVKLVRVQLVVRCVSTREVCILFVLSFWQRLEVLNVERLYCFFLACKTVSMLFKRVSE